MRRRLPLIRPLAALGTVFVLTIVAVFGLLRIDRVVVAPGAFTGGSVAVRAPLSGRVVEVAVAPGQQVTMGQVLLRFDDAPLAAEIALAEARLADLKRQRRDLEADLQRLTTGIHPAESLQARREVERRRLARDDASADWERTRDLQEAGLVPQETLQEAELTLRLAELDLVSRTEAAELLIRRHDETVQRLRHEVAGTAAEIMSDSLSRDEHRRRQSLTTVRAQADGQTVGPELYELVDRYVEEGDDLLRIERGAAARFEGWLDDHGRTIARRGQPVKIRLDGYPWLLHGTVPGTVASVAGHRRNGTDDPTGFPVVVAFEAGQGPGPLLDGMTGKARIVVGKRVTLGKLLLERVLGVDTP